MAVGVAVENPPGDMGRGVVRVVFQHLGGRVGIAPGKLAHLLAVDPCRPGPLGLAGQAIAGGRFVPADHDAVLLAVERRQALPPAQPVGELGGLLVERIAPGDWGSRFRLLPSTCPELWFFW